MPFCHVSTQIRVLDVSDRPYAPPCEAEHASTVSDAPYPAVVVCVLAFAIAGMTGISVLTDRPSIVSPFPIAPLILREKFDCSLPLVSFIGGAVFALVHARHFFGKPKNNPSIGLTFLLVCITVLTVLYCWIDFSVGLEVRGIAHTLLVIGYNVVFAILTWGYWIRSRSPGRYRAQVVFVLSCLRGCFGAPFLTWEKCDSPIVEGQNQVVNRSDRQRVYKLKVQRGRPVTTAVRPTIMGQTFTRSPAMSDTATQLLATFESLPEKEQHELLIAMLRRSGELPETMLSDDQLVVIADDLFQSLDAEESNGSDADPG